MTEDEKVRVDRLRRMAVVMRVTGALRTKDLPAAWDRYVAAGIEELAADMRSR